MKFSMSGKGEKKHSRKEGKGSEEKKFTSERVGHPKKIHKGRLGFFKKNKQSHKQGVESEKKTRDVSLCGLAIYIKRYLKAK